MNPSSLRVRTAAAAVDGRQDWFGVVRWGFAILLIFELVIRTFIMHMPRYIYSPGWGMIPTPYSYTIQGREGYGVLHYLEHGEIRTPYSGGVSVVVLGDSTVQAAQVNDNENFVSLTEAGLRQRGLKVDLHNLGAANRTVADFVYLAPAVEEAYHPQYVIVQVNQSTFSLAYSKARENHFEVAPDGSVKLVHRDAAEKATGFQDLISMSGLLSLLEFRWQMVQSEVAMADAGGLKNISAELNAFPREPDFVAQDASRDKVILAKIIPQAQLLKASYPDSKLIFLVVPYVPNILPGPEHEISWASGDDQLLAAALMNVPETRTIFIKDEFHALFKKFHLLPRGSFNSGFNFGHLNRAGHQAVARVLTDSLEALLK